MFYTQNEINKNTSTAFFLKRVIMLGNISKYIMTEASLCQNVVWHFSVVAQLTYSFEKNLN